MMSVTRKADRGWWGKKRRRGRGDLAGAGNNGREVDIGRRGGRGNGKGQTAATCLPGSGIKMRYAAGLGICLLKGCNLSVNSCSFKSTCCTCGIPCPTDASTTVN